MHHYNNVLGKEKTEVTENSLFQTPVWMNMQEFERLFGRSGGIDR